MVWKASTLGQDNAYRTPASAVMHYAPIIPIIVHKMAGMAPLKHAVKPMCDSVG
jgi:hypothetical protein